MPRTKSVGTAILAISLLASVPAWADVGECVSTEVDSPIKLPDGSLHESGKLTLCLTKPFSPVSSLHKTYVNGAPIGMLRSRKRTSEGGSDIEPVMLFHRDEEGSLALFGYVLPDRKSSVSYTFANISKPSRKHQTVASQPHGSSPLVVLASLSPR